MSNDDAIKNVKFKDMPIMPIYTREEQERQRSMYPPIGSVEHYIIELDNRIKKMYYRLDQMEKSAAWEREHRIQSDKTMAEMTKLLKESNEALAAYRKAFEE